MRTYVEAFRADGSQLLGNLDGQAVIYGGHWKRSPRYRCLLRTDTRPRWARVHSWHIVTEDGAVLSRVYNRAHNPSSAL